MPCLNASKKLSESGLKIEFEEIARYQANDLNKGQAGSQWLMKLTCPGLNDIAYSDDPAQWLDPEAWALRVLREAALAAESEAQAHRLTADALHDLVAELTATTGAPHVAE